MSKNNTIRTDNSTVNEAILSALFDNTSENREYRPFAVSSFLHSLVLRDKNDELLGTYLDLNHLSLDEFIHDQIRLNEPLMFNAALEAYVSNDECNALGRTYLSSALANPLVEIWSQDGKIFVSTIVDKAVVQEPVNQQNLDKAVVNAVTDLFECRSTDDSLWKEEAEFFIGWNKKDIPSQIENIDNGDVMFLLDDNDRVVGVYDSESDEEAEPIDALYCCRVTT